MILITRASQDFTGLAWVRYNAAFRRQAALTGNTWWSQIIATLYNTCFAGLAKLTTRCELCLATSHTEKDCALQGSTDPNMQDRPKTLESLVLAITPKQAHISKGSTREASGEPCTLWNQGRCSHPKCWHSHVCSRCGGAHQLPLAGAALQLPTIWATYVLCQGRDHRARRSRIERGTPTLNGERVASVRTLLHVVRN